MKKITGIMLLTVLFIGLNGFTFRETGDSIVAYLRRPIDLGVSVAVRAMNASARIVNDSAKATIETASTLYSNVTEVK